jgi:hypothetical protein
MRNLILLSLVATALAGCAAAPRPDGSPRVQTTSEANRQGLQGAASAPLRDFNVTRTKIPQVLLQATADPYERPPKRFTCAQLIERLEPLNDALGADLDEPSLDEDDLLAKGRGGAYAAMASVTSGAIPFRGWVRKLTGAERHDQLVQAAITAGAVRRAYLKGLGESRGCDPPATPSHIRQGAPVPTQELKPRYPIR